MQICLWVLNKYLKHTISTHTHPHPEPERAMAFNSKGVEAILVRALVGADKKAGDE